MGKEKKENMMFYKAKKRSTQESQVIENLQAMYTSIDETKVEKFCDLPLSQKTLRGLEENDYVNLTDIQKQCIGLALRENDILGAAKTGSGKTLAFVIPVVERLYCKQWSRMDGVGAIIITPTRELAYQIYETLRKVGRYHDISAGLIIGGKDLHFEKKRMDQCNIIVCTPGRLLQHMDENPLFNCVSMQILVLDEADRCLDMGFAATMNSIIENLPPERQTLLFSATQTKSVKDLARLSLKDPIYVSVHEHAASTTPDNLQQSYIISPLEDKMTILWSFIKSHSKQKIIVFFSSCKQVKYTFEAFCRLRPGLSLMALYGTIHQLRRMEIYNLFCKKQSAVLFATDIAARGLDFPAVNWVIQMDCPEDANTYIHRAGRTARLKNGGESLLFLLPSEIRMIDRLREKKIPINKIKINPEKLNSPQRKLEALLARDVMLKETAKRALVSYVKSVYLMKDKKIFDVHALDIDAYAKSLGLAISPRIRFLQKMQKAPKNTVNNKKTTETAAEAEPSTVEEPTTAEQPTTMEQPSAAEQPITAEEPSTVKSSTAKSSAAKSTTAKSSAAKSATAKSSAANSTTAKQSAAKSTTAESSMAKPSAAKSTTTKSTTAKQPAKATTILMHTTGAEAKDESEDDSDDDLLVVKRKNIQFDDEPVDDDAKKKGGTSSKAKPVTKAAVAKKMLRKNILPNKKTVFDEQGEELIDSKKRKASEIAKKYEEEEVQSGIDIETARKILIEEDRFDKQLFREKVKQKHREEKLKLKAQKMKETEEESESSGAEEEEEDESDEEGSEPDISWLPDLDKVYGKKTEDCMENLAEDTDEEEDMRIERKRKLIEEGYKNSQKRQKVLAMLKQAIQKADEELALKLLQD